jgi:hypothetical protein
MEYDEFEAHCAGNSNTPFEKSRDLKKTNEMEGLAYRDLQKRARELGLKGNMKKDALIQEIISKESYEDDDPFQLKVPRSEKSLKTLHFSGKVYKLCQVDAGAETFTVDIGIYCEWTDKSIIDNFHSLQTHTFNLTGHIWEPNWRLMHTTEESFVCDSTIEIVNFSSGRVRQYKHIRATLDCHLALEQFPVDSQRLEIGIRVPRHLQQGVLDITSDTQIPVDPKMCHVEFTYDLITSCVKYGCTGDVDRIKQLMRDLVSPSSSSTSSDISQVSAELNLKPEFIIHIYVKRKPTYWLYVIILPSYGCNLVGLLSLLLPADGLSDRINLVLTLILTSVGFKFTIMDRLPRLAYLTLLDKWLLSLFFINIAVAIEGALLHVFQSELSPASVSLINYSVFGGCFVFTTLCTISICMYTRFDIRGLLAASVVVVLAIVWAHA